MCIYCGSDNYRKIYKHHHGKIPKEPNGRTYEIHHIDGNHSNNNPSNLTAVTLQEHYNIHYERKEYKACHLIGGKLKLDNQILIELLRLAANRRVELGTHNFLSLNCGKVNTTVYKFVHMKTGEIIHATQKQLAVKLNTKTGHVGTLLCQPPVRKSILGWRLHPADVEVLEEYVIGRRVNTTMDRREYNFIHKSGIKFFGTRHLFIDQFDLSYKKVSTLIRGKAKSHKGWKLL
jgi:hypothetical protein